MSTPIRPALALLFAGVATHSAAGSISRHETRQTDASAKPIVLECKFTSGRVIQSVVVLPAGKKVRIWFNDGGGAEWSSVDTSQEPVATKVENGRALVLSRGLQHVTFYSLPDEQSEGSCWQSQRTDWPREHTAAVLRQPWDWKK